MKNVCSFCGRSEKEVRLLISGLNGHICDDCARQAYQIVQDNLKETSKTAKLITKTIETTVPLHIKVE